MSDLSAGVEAGIDALWGEDFVPTDWSSEYVTSTVINYLTTAAPKGLFSIYPDEKPVNWDSVPSNFTGVGIPFGASAIVRTFVEKQAKLRTGAGTGPGRQTTMIVEME